MLSYFPGGFLADRFSARKLITFSLIATALGGLVFALIPGFVVLTILFGYWGMTTVFLLWAAMIKATREWGGKLAQGRAFGLLDGGRGLVSAGAASLAVLILAAFLPDNLETISYDNRAQAIRSVIFYYSFLTLVAAGMTWFFIPDSRYVSPKSTKSLLSGMKYVIYNRSVWLQAIIVVCAYCGYKGLDYYTTYAVDILGMDEVSAARYMSNASYLRAVAAIGGGFLADKFTSKRVIGITFGLVLISYLSLANIVPEAEFLNIIYANLIFTFIAVYALRGVYFALLEETKVKGYHTGAAVGLISVIGFTPDIFFYAAGGRIIDASPGLPGFRYYYLFLGSFALLGLIATLILSYRKTFSKEE
jgi:nitrate/nitrite transporter NarK